MADPHQGLSLDADAVITVTLEGGDTIEVRALDPDELAAARRLARWVDDEGRRRRRPQFGEIVYTQVIAARFVEALKPLSLAARQAQREKVTAEAIENPDEEHLARLAELRATASLRSMEWLDFYQHGRARLLYDLEAEDPKSHEAAVGYLDWLQDFYRQVAARGLVKSALHGLDAAGARGEAVARIYDRLASMGLAGEDFAVEVATAIIRASMPSDGGKESSGLQHGQPRATAEAADDSCGAPGTAASASGGA